MGFIKNSTYFGPTAKYIRFDRSNLSIIESSRTISKMDLGDVLVNYDQYINQRFIIPKGTKNKEISLANLDTVVTFVLLKACYDVTNPKPELNYLTFAFENDLSVTYPIGKMMVLSGIPQQSVAKLFVNNPNPDYAVTLDVVACTTDFASVSQTAYAYYVTDIEFTNIQTYVQGVSIAIFDKDGNIAAISDLNDISTFSRDGRILTIDDSAVGTIGIQFTSEYHALQALSALTWLKNDTANRSLPQDADATAPAFTLTSNVTTSGSDKVATMSLATNAGTITKSAIATWCIDYMLDNRDGSMPPSAAAVEIKRSTVFYNSIVNTGVYTVTFTATDIAGNSSTQVVILTVTS